MFYGRVVVEQGKEYRDAFHDGCPELRLDPRPVVLKPAPHGLELLKLAAIELRLREHQQFKRYGLLLQISHQLRPLDGPHVLLVVIEPVPLAGAQILMVEIDVLIDQEEPRRERVPPFFNPLGQQLGIDGAQVHVEQRDVVVEHLVQQDDEFDKIRVGLLPERLLAFAEQVIEQTRDTIRQRIRFQIVVQRVIAKVARQIQFQIIFRAAAVL